MKYNVFKHSSGEWKASGLSIYSHKVTEDRDLIKIIAVVDPKRGDISEENFAIAKVMAASKDLLYRLTLAVEFLEPFLGPDNLELIAMKDTIKKATE